MRNDRETSRSRRDFLRATSAATVVALAGCRGETETDGSEPTATATATPSEAETLSVVAGAAEGQLFQRLLDEYLIEETGVEVEVSLFDYRGLHEEISSVLQTESDGFDIAFMDDPWFPEFAADLEPIREWLPEDLPEEQLIDTTVEVATWPPPRGPVVPSAEGTERRLRGQVIVGNVQLFAYNREYYEQVGASAPPQTWTDVLRAGRAIDEGIDGVHGYTIRGKEGNPISINYFGLANSRVGNMFDEEWRYQWAGSDGIDTLRFYVEDLAGISPDGVTTFDSDSVLGGIGNGSAAQAPAWPGEASLLLEAGEYDQAGNIAFTQLPEGIRRAPSQGNWILGINSYTSDARKRAAGRVIRQAISKPAQQRYVELGGVPFRHDIFQDNMDAQLWFPALYESLQTAQWRPRTPLWSDIVIVQSGHLNDALGGSVDPESALSSIESEVENLMEAEGYYR